MVARPLLVLHLTDSAVHLGLVMAVRTIPSLLLGLLAGVVADNFNRRTVLLTTKVVVFCLGAVFAFIMVMGWIELWHVYVFTLVRGATMAFDQPARRAMIPSLVPKHLVTNAIALSSGSIQVTRIVGAGGAGLIMAFAGLEAAFVAIAVFYAAAVLFTWMLRVPDHARQGYRGVRSMGADLIEGLRFAWNEPTVRGIIIVAAGYFTFGFGFMQVFGPLFAKQVLEIGNSGFGYMMAVTGVGGVVGTLLLASLNPNRRRGLIIIVLLVIFGLLQVVVAGSTYLGSVALVFLMAGLLGMGQSSLFPLINAVLLQAAPENMRGRVIGLLTLDRAFATLGAAMGGLLAAAVGAQLAQIIFGVACVFTALGLLASYPALRRID